MRVRVSLAAPFLIYFNHSGFKTFINAEPQFNFLLKSKNMFDPTDPQESDDDIPIFASITKYTEAQWA